MKHPDRFAYSVVISALLATGCGGGSGDSDGLNVNVIQPDSIVPSVVDGPPPVVDGPPPVVDGPPPDVDDPPPAMDDPQPTAELSKLFGRTVFVFRFEPSGTASFFYDLQISDENFVVSQNDGATRIVGNAEPSFINDGEETITRGTPQPMGCSDVESNARILCTAFSSTGSTTNFLLPYLEDNQSFGDFEFCTEDETVTDCITDLLNTPDGNVLIQTNLALSALAARSIGNTVVFSDTDQIDYMNYEDQSSDSLAQFYGTSPVHNADVESALSRNINDLASQ